MVHFTVLKFVISKFRDTETVLFLVPPMAVLYSTIYLEGSMLLSPSSRYYHRYIPYNTNTTDKLTCDAQNTDVYMPITPP